MSIITVQLGQCGNEIGQSLFTLLHNDSIIPAKYTSPNSVENVAYRADTCDRYFTEQKDGRQEAKAVLIDMEPKVVNKCMQSNNGEFSLSVIFTSFCFKNNVFKTRVG